MIECRSVCIFGEVLFDHFPDGQRVLGGAPFNVAWHLQAFGLAPVLISRVGRDPEGAQIRDAMDKWGLTTRLLQTDPDRPTGRVAVTLRGGEPDYDIVADCAYDHIEAIAPGPCRLLYHGSLAARAVTSASTLRSLRSGSGQSVFIDVNLRPPWWRRKVIDEWLRGADWVKLNSDELAALTGARASTASGRDFLRRYQLRGLLITRGARGAELLLAGGETLRVAPEPCAEPVDPVGAGDAFAAVFLLGLLHEWPVTVTLKRAGQFAAAIIGQRGAIVSDIDYYRSISRQWQLTD